MIVKTARVRLIRAAVAVVFLAGTLAACGESEKPEGADGIKTLAYMANPGQTVSIPIYVGDEAGIFKDRGIAIKYVPQPGALPPAQGLVATNSQIGAMSTASLVQGFQGGNGDVVMFCGNTRYVDASIVTKKENLQPGASRDHSISEMSGKKVGVISPVGTAFQMLIDATLRENGAKDVKYVLVGTTPAVVQAALDKGGIDYAVTVAPTTQLLMRQDPTVATLADLPKVPGIWQDTYGGGFVATTAWLDDNKALAASFCEAVEESASYVKDPKNADVVDAVIEEELGVEGEAAAVVRERLPKLETALPEDVISNTLKIFSSIGILKSTPAVSFHDVIRPAGKP